jgi:hypothetical protein
MRKAVASLFPSLEGADEQSDEFVTVVDDAIKENLNAVSR